MKCWIENGLSVVVIALIITAIVFISPKNSLGAEEKDTFTGTWSASGEWQPVNYGDDREVFTFMLSGHVNLKNEIGEVTDFWSECLGLWDAATGSTTRCTWREPEGENVAYLVLKGRLVEEKVEMTGEFVGGAGALKGLTGEIAFSWSSVYRNSTDRILTRYSKNLVGTYRIVEE